MATKTHGHSAAVAIAVISAGRRIPVAQIGNSGLLVRNLDEPIPPGEATLVIRIDDSLKRYKIVLPHGITESNRFTNFF